MSTAEMRAQFAEAAEREAARGAAEHPLVSGSDAAIALAGLCSGFTELVRERSRLEHRPAA